jgi:hypothetical protein
MEEVKLYHPYWIRIIGWVFLPVMLLVSIWCLFLPVWYERYEISLVLAGIFLGGGCLYMSVHGIKTLPFMNAVITVSDRQIEVYRKSSTVAVRWTSITKIRHVASTQVLHLYDDKGQRFLSITEQLNGYAFLVGLLHEKSGLDV